MKKCYINGISCISAQPTFENKIPGEAENEKAAVLYAVQPSYKDLIPPAAGRRMAKGVKMGIYTSHYALKEAGTEEPEVIIIGSGMGCMEDSEKFLSAILDNDEQFLTPTSFIQSTHNTVGGQIALGLGCKGYNFTYVNGSVSFESALADSCMQLKAGEIETALTGGVDETAPRTLELLTLNGTITTVPDQKEIKAPDNTGVIYGEGAGCFVIENIKKPSSYAEIAGIEMINDLLPDEVGSFIRSFLERNGSSPEEIDLIILGNNGNIQDEPFYQAAEELFPAASRACYKHLSGEYPTASVYALWSACHILKEKSIPAGMQVAEAKGNAVQQLLLYNQNGGTEHSLILLKNVEA